MKKLYFSLTIAAFCFTTNAQVINFPDAAFKAKLLSGTAANSPIDTNGDNEIDVSEAEAVDYLMLQNSNISDLTGIEFFANLTALDAYNNSITSLDLSGLTQLARFDVHNNNLSTLNFSGLTSLHSINCYGNLLTALDLDGLISLQSLSCSYNQLTVLEIQNLPLSILWCSNNQITTLDLSANSTLWALNCSNNSLQTLYLKGHSYLDPDFSGNPQLQYVCAEDYRLESIREKLVQYNNTNAYTNSYCEHTTDGDHYSITGHISYDEQIDGCDATEAIETSVPLKFSVNSIEGADFSNADGSYSYDVQSGTHTVQAIVENPSYYTVSPPTAQVSISASGNNVVQNFCITPNGIHPDLAITINHLATPYELDYNYKIIYSNKGTHTQSGTVTLNFDDALINILGSDTPANSQVTGTVTWTFTNLKPFEAREIIFYTALDPEVGLDFSEEIVDFAVSVNSSATDESPSNNQDISSIEVGYYFLLGTPEVAEKPTFKLYPNPASSELTINAGTHHNYTVDIYDLMGRLVISVPDATNTRTINVSALQAGQYLVMIGSEGTMVTKRLLKK